MSFDLFLRNAPVLTIVGFALGVFLFMILLMLNRTPDTRNATKDVRSVIRKVMALSFIVGFFGVWMWQSEKMLSSNLGGQILNVFTKISMDGKGRIIAEKENGKIIIVFRKSCLKEFVGVKKNAGIRIKEHWIYMEFTNHFDHSVTIKEYHVNSRFDGEEILGYDLTDKSKALIKPGETEILKFSASLPSVRIMMHLEEIINDFKPTQEIVLITSEGPLPPIPVSGPANPCLN